MTGRIFTRGFLRSALAACSLLGPAFAMAQPSFTGGSPLFLSTCLDASGTSINSLLSVNDPSSGLTETWSVVSFPVNGVLSGFSATATSTGGTVVPTGLSYTPNASYVGADSFTVQVSDGSSAATATIYVTVHPVPQLSSTLLPASICDLSTFSYTPTSTTPGASFTWSRGFNGGISNPTTTGSGSISETLDNVTYYDVPVTYTYTTQASGCSSQQNVTVTVHPSPRLSSALYDTTCTGGTFTYVPVATTPGTTFTWSRAAVAGVSPSTSSGSGNISETLTDSTGSAVNIVYTFMLSDSGCTATRNLTVTLLPTAPITSITTASPSSVCTNTLFQNFGAGIAPPAGATYVWTAMNADVVTTGKTGQYALISFPSSGSASVSLGIIMAGNHCANSGTYAVTVTGNVSQPGASIVYFDNQLVYQDNTADSYQWGYDNASTLAPTTITGATFQSYPFAGATPDFTNNYYWVMINKFGCMQKVYYNMPPTSVPVARTSANNLRVYPDPASTVLNVDLGSIQATNTTITIENILGQSLKTTSATQSAQFDIASLPAGCYFVSCVQNGVKVATARFIKN